MSFTVVKLFYFLLNCVLILNVQCRKNGFMVEKEWKQLDWEFSNDSERQKAIENEDFIPENAIIIDTDVYYNSLERRTIFATVPRFNKGIPASLNIVTNRTNNGNPLLRPFPSWRWHRNLRACNKDRIVSVFRIHMDECKRLWVLDSGRIEEDLVCSPQILAFNPKNGAILHRYEIPSGQVEENSILLTPVTDVRDPLEGCNDIFIYNADAGAAAIIVYDAQNRKSWKIKNKLFQPDPNYENYTIDGTSYFLDDGIFALALSPYVKRRERILFFHSLSSVTENYVPTSIIRNESLFLNNESAAVDKFVTFANKRSSQATVEAVDKSGIMYFALTTEIEVDCWNIYTTFSQKNFAVIDNNKRILQFASGMKTAVDPLGVEELWLVTTRFQKFYTDTMNWNETNYRILKGNIKNLLQGKKCSSKGSRAPI